MIIVPKHRIRSRFRGDDGGALEASIEAVNIQSPLGIKRVEGSYVLDDGENRLRIAIEKGINPVPCVVTEGTMLDVIKANVSSLNKGTPNPRELMAELAALNREEEVTVEDLAEWSGRREEWVEEMLEMEEALSPAVKQMLGEELIALGHAELLADLYTQGEEQERWLHLVLENRWTVAELREHLMADPDNTASAPEIRRAPAPRNPRVCSLCHTEQTHGTIQTMQVCDGCAKKMGGSPAPEGGLIATFREALPELRQGQDLLARLPGSAHLAERLGTLVEAVELDERAGP